MHDSLIISYPFVSFQVRAKAMKFKRVKIAFRRNAITATIKSRRAVNRAIEAEIGIRKSHGTIRERCAVHDRHAVHDHPAGRVHRADSTTADGHLGVIAMLGVAQFGSADEVRRAEA